ncbi:SWIB/MDM2 domain protein [Cladochytrium replicatum]|nr:SWIB/MDM2 domain protein [Cladochytrium replicatum]
MAPLDPQSLVPLIRKILVGADVNTITAKEIRKGLEADLGDLSEHKKAVSAVIREVFEDFLRQQDGNGDEKEDEDDVPLKSEAAVKSESNGSKIRGHPMELATSGASSPVKKEGRMDIDQDMKLAKELQDEELAASHVRPRRAAARAAAPKSRARKTKKKSSSTIDEDGDSAKKKRRAGGGFQKPYALSEAMAAITGQDKMSRPKVVQMLWKYIKANDLQDPDNKRKIRCDEVMRRAFKTDLLDMFQMNKILSNHLSELSPEEVKECQRQQKESEQDQPETASEGEGNDDEGDGDDE